MYEELLDLGDALDRGGNVIHCLRTERIGQVECLGHLFFIGLSVLGIRIAYKNDLRRQRPPEGPADQRKIVQGVADSQAAEIEDLVGIESTRQVVGIEQDL